MQTETHFKQLSLTIPISCTSPAYLWPAIEQTQNVRATRPQPREKCYMDVSPMQGPLVDAWHARLSATLLDVPLFGAGALASDNKLQQP